MTIKITPLKVQREWFKDDFNRTVILRGVNLGGDCKVPFDPDERTHIPTDFSDHENVSFIGRPFPIEEADTHFNRLKEWGFNVLRLLTTWEAVEHQGPGKYDRKYIDYYAKLCEMAGEHGMHVFVDFHQDVWSRMTGGDGAPCWLFEKIGIDYTKLSAADAALVMQHAYDFEDPRPRQEDNYPMMCWSQNYKYAGNAIMWTLFFAGRDFTPDFTIEGQNVQDYMQSHYFGCLQEVGKAVKDLPNVMGFDSLNEPDKGWIGTALNDRHLFNKTDDPALPGIAWSPIDALYSSHGFSIEMPYMELSIIKGGFIPKRKVKVNPSKISIWLEEENDPLMEAGAWILREDGTYEILNNEFFQLINDRKINFDRDYMFPFIGRVAEKIREIKSDWLIFAEKDATEATFDPIFPSNTPKDIVNATHWYDITITGIKRVFYPFSLDIHTKKPVIGQKRIQKLYEKQLGAIKEASRAVNDGNCATLIGEFGIPFDLSNGKAYKKWIKGKRLPKIWKRHVMALNLMYNALDTLLINGTIWNYTASNRNDLKIGDGWNQEDISIFSEDQRDDPSNINSGGRALRGFVRPFAKFIQGTPLEMKFNLKRGVFLLKYSAESSITQPTEIFVPRIQFPKGYRLQIKGNSIIKKESYQHVSILSKENQDVVVKIIRT